MIVIYVLKSVVAATHIRIVVVTISANLLSILVHKQEE